MSKWEMTMQKEEETEMEKEMKNQEEEEGDEEEWSEVMRRSGLCTSLPKHWGLFYFLSNPK